MEADIFSIFPVSNDRIHNQKERQRMDINDLLEQTMKAINEYADEIVAERMKL